jgi:hypothetical protein
VIIPFDLTQLSCPGFTLAAGPPSGFTTDIVGCGQAEVGKVTFKIYGNEALSDESV